MEYDDTKFSSLLEGYGGLRRIVKSVDFKLALIVEILFTILTLNLETLESIIVPICPLFATISATMIAISLAGVAIVASLSDPEFIKKLKKANIYHNILFPYWYSTMISGFSVIVNVFTYITFSITDDFRVHLSLFSVSSFFATYSLFSVILLVGTTMRYGIYRGAFLENNNRNIK